MKRIFAILLIFLCCHSYSQDIRWSDQMAATAMQLWPDSFALPQDKFAKWRYDQGVILKGIEGVWRATGDNKWFNYIQRSMDFYIRDDGTINRYKTDEYNIDHINNGKLLLLLYEVTGKDKYRKAASLLREQLRNHPRTSEGGFWHKKIYPYQMWLDGLYMAQPFYAEYAKIFKEDSAFNDITRQFVLMEQHARDEKTGLLYHGWDESREQKWADSITGLSPHFWGRSLGWFGMALVDALDHFPKEHPGRKQLINILNRFSTAVASVQDEQSGLWYDIPNLPQRKGNYVEASASAMLVYTLAKAVRKNYIPANYIEYAKKGYSGIISSFLKTGEKGQVDLHGTVSVSGLGGKPYRDGSFEYYISEPVIVNDPKGIGAFIKCAVEMEMIETIAHGKGRTILLDYYFNNEWKYLHGINRRWHYTWEDQSNSGYAFLGNMFERHGVSISNLQRRPATSLLRNASMYLIVDPDTRDENSDPRFILAKDIRKIRKWVKGGGLLILMGNDSANSEFNHFNKLAGNFGIKFNQDSKFKVINNDYRQGTVVVEKGNEIFDEGRKLFLKEVSTLSLSGNAIPLLQAENNILMAKSSYGKGQVFAVGDPWIYNEYLDGRKLPAILENFSAAGEWIIWLLKHSTL